MDSTNKAIGIACENGYRWKIDVSLESMLLDPLFWQALGKGLGWEDTWIKYEVVNGVGGKSLYRDDHRIAGGKPLGGGTSLSEHHEKIDTWKYHWHRFIDHLAEGKDIESFFTNLIP